VGFIGATLEKPRIIVTEYMARGSLFGILRDTSIDLPAPLRLQMALDMALGPRIDAQGPASYRIPRATLWQIA